MPVRIQDEDGVRVVRDTDRCKADLGQLRDDLFDRALRDPERHVVHLQPAMNLPLAHLGEIAALATATEEAHLRVGSSEFASKAESQNLHVERLRTFEIPHVEDEMVDSVDLQRWLFHARHLPPAL